MNSRLLDASLQSFEKTLNIFGYIPIVSSFSATIREAFGDVELISGVAIAAFSALANNERQVDHGVELAIHGVANICRSCVEMIPFINLACIPYDISNRFEYQSLRPHFYHCL
jgi:hypothetical protein